MGRIAELQARAKAYQQRAEEMRREHGSVDVAYVLADRDSEIGGGLMAGALAYRLFIWLLPFALVVVGGIGIAAAADESSTTTTHALGLGGIVSTSVAQATANGSSRWYALAIGIPLLLWATRSLLKALVVVHRLVWGDPRRTVPKPTVVATLWLLVFLVSYFAIQQLARWVGIWTGSYLLRLLAALVLLTLWWLLVSHRLPHREARTLALLPGALVMAVGLDLISNVGVYYITRRLESSQSTYGALGVAATLLFGLYLISRLIVGSAVLNATMWERRVEHDRQG
jgi:uncharacterized BrkB/YihY/UPF0761 family membrane protein